MESPDRMPRSECVHCGLCLSACPTYVELGTEMDSPRGRLHLMRGLADGSLSLTHDVTRHLDLCLGCRACETACPSGVPYASLLEQHRAELREKARRPWWDRLRRAAIPQVFSRPSVLKVLVLPLRLLELLGVLDGLRRIFPSVAGLPVLRDWQPLPAVAAAAAAQRKVALLSGCVAQVLFAETNRASVRVLTRNGCTVVTPAAQGCCGALFLHAGDVEAARRSARRNLDAFPPDADAVIANAAGCGAMLKQYGDLLADDRRYAERARAFSARVHDISDWLVRLPFEAPTGSVATRATYHDACHLAHAQGIRDAPRTLLRSIPGLELVEMQESDFCCGSAGSYSLTEPQMAQRLGERKAAHIEATGAHLVVTANPGCVMQIRSALARRGVHAVVKHPVELLDEAYPPA